MYKIYVMGVVLNRDHEYCLQNNVPVVHYLKLKVVEYHEGSIEISIEQNLNIKVSKIEIQIHI